LGNIKDHQTTLPSGSGSSSARQQAQQSATSNLMNIWSSIFPNENYQLIADDWEKKIIIDPEVQQKQLITVIV
jgi:hypothetical protein